MANRQGTRKADGDSYISPTPDANGYYHAIVSMGNGPDGKRDRRHRMSRDLKALRATVRKLEQQRDSWKAPKKGRVPTVREMLERHLDVTLPARGRKPKTIYSYRSTCEQHIYPMWGQYRIDKLRDDQIEDGIALMLARGQSAAHARKMLAILSSAYAILVKRGEVARNPCASVDPPALGPSTQTALTEAEALAVFRVATTRDNAARWSVGLACGLRQGEALGLRWSYLDIDVAPGENGRMRVWWQLQRLPWRHGCADDHPKVRQAATLEDRQKAVAKVEQECAEQWHKHPCPKRCPKKRASGRPHTCIPADASGLCKPGCVKHAAQCPQRKDGGLVFAEIKEGGRKTVPIPPKLVAELRAHRDSQYLHQLAMANEWTDHDLVFSQWNGKALDPRQDWQEWTDILKAAGLPHHRVHAMRHSAATIMLSKGVALPVVQEMMGHSDIRVTRLYTHVDDPLMQDAAGRMDGLLKRPEPA